MKGKNLAIIVLIAIVCFLSYKIITNEMDLKKQSALLDEKEKEIENLKSEENDDSDESLKVDQTGIKQEEALELSDFLNSEDGLETPTREYGVEEVVINNTGKILTYMVYPQGGISELDKACENWVNESLEKYESEEDLSDGNLLISYNSYQVGEQYVLVEFKGEFYSSSYAHPISFFASFNADSKTGKLLSIEDVLEAKKIAKLKDYVIQEYQVDENFIDDEFLDDWMIRDNGIEIVLEKGKYLPESAGTVRAIASYKMLNSSSDTLVSAELDQDVKKKKKELNKMELDNLNKVKNKTEGLDELSIDPNEKLIALTFDDGPGAHTARLLDILKEHNVKATFFVLGSQIDSHPDLLQRMIEEEHEIGGHSWTHRSFTTLSDEEVKKEIMQTRAKIASITGYDALSVRPPYGAYNDKVKELGKNLGVHFVNWNVDPLDWKTKDANKTYNAIVDIANHGNIVLSHDIHVSTVDAMERIIPELLSKGYRFVTVSEMLSHGRGKIEAGEVYFSMNK